MSKQEFTHVFPLSVRWGDADVYGHINNVQFVRFIESARVAYCEQVLDLALVVGMEAGWVLADIQCSYLKQVHYPATLEVYTRISKVGNKSAHIVVEMYQKDVEKPVLTSQAVMVWVDLKQNKSALIPDSMKSKIVAFEKSVEGITA